jgi:nucleoside-diphosphate-sugar epimerase
MQLNSRKVFVTGGSGFIGTNLVEHLLLGGAEVLNFDRNVPANPDHAGYWTRGRVGDMETLDAAIRDFRPEYIVHLAARTDLLGRQLNDYQENITGAENLIRSVTALGGVERILFTSSMLVSGPGKTPVGLDDCLPDSPYGQSKLQMERVIHEAHLPAEWLIVRPTSIWGPWFGEPYRNFFDIVMKGRFLHPGNRACTKTYGFVGNSVRQIEALITAPKELVQGKTFYLGDSPPLNISRWADQIRVACHDRVNNHLPYCAFSALGLIGDFLKLAGIKFPMTSFRLRNMTTNNEHDLRHLEAVAGKPHFNAEDGIRMTLEWLASPASQRALNQISL